MQQKIAQGVQDHGLGDMPGMALGLGLVQGINPQTAAPVEQRTTMSFDQQVDAVKKMKELFDAGVLSEDEFNIKKKEIMGL